MPSDRPPSLNYPITLDAGSRQRCLDGSHDGRRLLLRNSRQTLLNVQAGNGGKNARSPIHSALVQLHLGAELLTPLRILIPQFLQPVHERRRRFLPGHHLASQLQQGRQRVLNRLGSQSGEHCPCVAFRSDPRRAGRLTSRAASVKLAWTGSWMARTPAGSLSARTFALPLAGAAELRVMTVTVWREGHDGRQSLCGLAMVGASSAGYL